MRLIVVGAGIAGSSVTRIARDRGHQVTLISENRPHSLAAVAVLRRAYHTGEERDLFDRSLHWYRVWDIPWNRGAHVTSYRTDKAKFDMDWRIIEPAAPLVAPDVTGRAATAHFPATPVLGVAVLGGNFYAADAVVWAVGAHAAESCTWGTTLVHPNPRALPDGVSVHHYGPYKTLVGGETGGQCRMGSSSGKHRQGAVDRGKVLLDLAVNLGWTDGDGWTLETGLRGRNTVTSGCSVSGSYFIRGFHRTGYALGPAVAERLVRRIESDRST